MGVQVDDAAPCARPFGAIHHVDCKAPPRELERLLRDELTVTLHELRDEDQLAVSLATDSEGKFQCDLQPAPAYDVTIAIG